MNVIKRISKNGGTPSVMSILNKKYDLTFSQTYEWSYINKPVQSMTSSVCLINEMESEIIYFKAFVLWEYKTLSLA